MSTSRKYCCSEEYELLMGMIWKFAGTQAVRLGASLSAQTWGDPGARGEHTAQVSAHEFRHALSYYMHTTNGMTSCSVLCTRLMAWRLQLTLQWTTWVYWHPNFTCILVLFCGRLMCILQIVWFHLYCFQASLLCFGTFVLADENNVLTAENTFVSLSYFNIISIPLNFAPMHVMQCAQVSGNDMRCDVIRYSACRAVGCVHTTTSWLAGVVVVTFFY